MKYLEDCKMKKFLKYLVPSILGSGITIAVFLILGLNKTDSGNYREVIHSVPAHKAVFTVKENGELMPLDFTGVSKQVMNSVVHVTSKRKVSLANNYYGGRNPFSDMFGDDFFRFFYGNPEPNQKQKMPQSFEQVGTGSGVIINSNGYIVTNNHVIEDASEIEVTLHNNNVYKAKVVGADPSTDIALLQIKEDNLPALSMGNSDNVEVGEWVMAIGNPFNLDATVTAGIVSAKGRNINIIDDKSAIEAFIQTDAAINPGNSGGALVDLNGELIGINTAIASPTGAYAGYGFAVPTSIVKKVVEDFMKYGMVQRAYLGVMIRDINGDLKEQEHLKISEGAYVDSLVENSAAARAGIKEGDVITDVEGTPILKTADLLEQIGTHRPGDEVRVTVNRNGKEMDFMVALANQKGSGEIIAREEADLMDLLGGSFENLDKNEAKALGIEGGVVIKELNNGILKNNTDLEEGFIITGINNRPVKNVDDMKKILEKENGGVMIEGMYKDFPGKIYVAFGLTG